MFGGCVRTDALLNYQLMGAWGTAIFSDDFAADIRSEFRELIGDAHTAEEATRVLKARYAKSLTDVDDGSVFWLALAATQHRLGCLQPHVLTKALEIIDGGSDLKRWEGDTKALRKRERILQETRAEITSPQPTPKKVAKTFRDANDWAVGQVAAYRLSSGSYCVFVVIGHHEDRGGRSPVVEVLDWTGSSPPSEAEIAHTRIRRPSSKDYEPQLMVGATAKREMPVDRVVVLSFRRAPSQRPNGYVGTLWRMLDQTLEEMYGLR